MFIVLIRYTCPIERIDAVIEEHREFLRRYYDKGVFIASGPVIPREGGVVLAREDSKEKLMAIFREDPFYREQIASYQIIQFEPTMYRGEFQNVRQFLQPPN